jgi:hypothetical protein
MLSFEPPEDGLRDEEYPDEPTDVDIEDDDATIDCPACGAAVYEDAPHCPHCGHWLTEADRRGDGGLLAGRPWWWIVLGLLGLVATIAMLSGWF